MCRWILKKNCYLYLICVTLFCIVGCSKLPEGAVEQLYIVALDAYTDNELSIAHEYVAQIEKADKAFYQATFLKAKIYFFQENYSESLEVLEKLVKKYPAFTEARIWSIRCLIFLEEYEKAEKLLEIELSFNQTDWRVYYQYSLLATRTNNYEMRLAMSSRAESALSDGAKVYIDLAEVWATFEFSDRALLYLEKAQVISGSQSSVAEFHQALESAIQEGE